MYPYEQVAMRILAGALALGVLLAACAPAPGAPSTPTAPPTAIVVERPTDTPMPPTPQRSGLADMLDALRAGGARVEELGQADRFFFSGQAWLIVVNGETVQVFEYVDEQAREAESSQITPDGQPNATTIAEWVDTPNYWAKGRLIVLYVGRNADVIARLTKALGEPVVQMAMEEGRYPDAVRAAIKALSTMRSIPEGDITVDSYQAAEWRDSCLGLGRAEEMCAQVITPGYLVLLSAGGVQFELHTNESGSAVRMR